MGKTRAQLARKILQHIADVNLAEQNSDGDSIRDLFNDELGIESNTFSGDYNDLTGFIPPIPALPQVPANTSQEKHYLLKVSDFSGRSNRWEETEVFTIDHMRKLNSIANNATVNTQSDWNQSNSNHISFIKNKPRRITATQVQSDWAETNPADPSFIQNKWPDQQVGFEAWTEFPTGLSGSVKRNLVNSIGLGPTDIANKIWNHRPDPPIAISDSAKQSIRNSIVRTETIRTVVPLPHETVNVDTRGDTSNSYEIMGLSIRKLGNLIYKFYILEYSGSYNTGGTLKMRVIDSDGAIGNPEEQLVVDTTPRFFGGYFGFQIYNNRLYLLNSTNQIIIGRLEKEVGDGGSYLWDDNESGPFVVTIGDLTRWGAPAGSTILDFQIIDDNTVYYLCRRHNGVHEIRKTYLTTGTNSSEPLSSIAEPKPESLGYRDFVSFALMDGPLLNGSSYSNTGRQNYTGGYTSQDSRGLNLWNSSDKRLLTFPLLQGRNIDTRFRTKGVAYDLDTQKIYCLVNDEIDRRHRSVSIRVFQIQEMVVLR